ncbi:hypothetical protein C8F01DRAFT_507082 [Mycena amicta]|nr:hypothetical protein C8F01DRAFT_507082 [Mycena amicta]
MIHARIHNDRCGKFLSTTTCYDPSTIGACLVFSAVFGWLVAIVCQSVFRHSQQILSSESYSEVLSFQLVPVPDYFVLFQASARSKGPGVSPTNYKALTDTQSHTTVVLAHFRISAGAAYRRSRVVHLFNEREHQLLHEMVKLLVSLLSENAIIVVRSMDSVETMLQITERKSRLSTL